MSSKPIPKQFDQSPQDFRRHGYAVVDWIAEFLEDPYRYPVRSRARPGEIAGRLAEQPPERGRSMEAILKDFEEILLPGVTHWNHPAFFAYFSITSSGPGMLGEFLCSALNVNAMLWETSPAATELEERCATWVRRLLGLPEEFWGVIYDTASISTLHAIVAARQRAVPECRREGLFGARRMRLYTSEQAHSSVEKAVITLGLGHESVSKIPVDAEFRMIPEKLEAAIESDVQAGWIPFCVVATIGTTSTTSVDPVQAVASVCERRQLWLHVDAAYAGSAAVLPERRSWFEGWERADSIVMNPHKWLFTPLDLSLFFTRHRQLLKESFSLVPEYLRTDADAVATNFMDYGVQLGRRFRALKLWMVLSYFGAETIREVLRYHVEMAERFCSLIDASADFERMAPAPFSTVCFRLAPDKFRHDQTSLDDLNKRLLKRVNGTGEVFLSQTKLRGKVTLRLAIGNIKTEMSDVLRAWEIIEEKAAEITGS